MNCVYDDFVWTNRKNEAVGESPARADGALVKRRAAHAIFSRSRECLWVLFESVERSFNGGDPLVRGVGGSFTVPE
jgi:hypothetical protein